jgi:RNA-directed DNA polymerase
MQKNKKDKKPRWQLSRLGNQAEQWLQRIKKSKPPVSEQSPWWDFLFYFKNKITGWLSDFVQGVYQFSPMQTYTFSNEKIIMWSYRDRLMLSLLLTIIKPLFPHIISKNCLHLKGPAGVKTALGQIQKALDTQDFRYIIRADVSSYYASINHQILIQQVEQKFDDPRLLHYLKNIITIATHDKGNILTTTTGIPIRSSLSPFFGALYLSPIDSVFEKREGIYYIRFMDDIIVLAKTKRQFLSAKKRLRDSLRSLKLKLSRSKTRMGLIKNNFHFLGVQFCLTQIKQKEFQVMASIHKRSCYRALTRVCVMREDAGSPDNAQRYLHRWATWWSRALCQLKIKDVVLAWIAFVRVPEPTLAWLGSGLLLS